MTRGALEPVLVPSTISGRLRVVLYKHSSIVVSPARRLTRPQTSAHWTPSLETVVSAEGAYTCRELANVTEYYAIALNAFTRFIIITTVVRAMT